MEETTELRQQIKALMVENLMLQVTAEEIDSEDDDATED